MRRIGVLLLVGCLQSAFGCCQTSEWEAVVEQFQEDYDQLDIPYLMIAYVDNLYAIQDLEALANQSKVFAELQSNLAHTDRSSLNTKAQLEYDLLQYLLTLNEERIVLERQWWDNPPHPIPTDGLASLPNGQDWYRYFLKRWLDISVTPEELFAFGMEEIHQAQLKLRALQKRSGKDSTDFYQAVQQAEFVFTSPQQVQAAFETFRTEMLKKLPAYFPGMDQVPAVYVEQSTQASLAHVPGYYRNNTFYYNIYDQSFKRRDIAWLFMHEAIPGHHYERSYSSNVTSSVIQQLYNNPCYSEGWAAYVEEIGVEVGAYQNVYDELGQWEWDIIRSVRVPLDVGINYYGWSDERALEFWQQYIKGQDDIAEREIARMRRWPCQVITYKYGANKILEWKARKEQDAGFDLKEFHRQLLQYGPIPFSLLEDRLLATVN